MMLAHDLSQNRFSIFGIMRGPKMKCAASPGGTFGILLPVPPLSTGRQAFRFATQLRRKWRF
jgi:hypothetical protein